MKWWQEALLSRNNFLAYYEYNLLINSYISLYYILLCMNKKKMIKDIYTWIWI